MASPCAQTLRIRELNQTIVRLIDQLKDRDEREKEMIKRLAALQRALGGRK